jgi:hypothetical protein
VSKPNDVLRTVAQYTMFTMTKDPFNATLQLERLEQAIWLAKETLKAQAVKQKTWDQKVESQEVQLEQESSTPNNDQTSLEKEQSQRTTKTNKLQFIITFPDGHTICPITRQAKPNWVLANQLLNSLKDGKSVLLPITWKVQVIERNDL